MTSLMMRKPIGARGQKLIGSSRETETQSSSMPKLQRGISRIQFWAFGMQMEDRCDERDSVAQVATSYFESIYTTSHPNHIEEVIAVVPIKVTDDMNARLTRNFSREEVVIALKQIHPIKTPGPDGMSAIFYQNYWSIVGDSVTNLVLNVLNGSMTIAELNKTNITLILKTRNPKRMAEFRPISLYNLIYKLISKTLADHLKNLLPQIITENQSAFTFDQLIIDNVLVAFKLMHYLNHKTLGKDGYMAAKLDMSKAFDRVE